MFSLSDHVTRERKHVTQKQDVLEYVRTYPGKTSAELAQLKAHFLDKDESLWKLYRDMFARRLPDLEPLNIQRGDRRKCTVCGNRSETWWPR